MMEGMEEGRKKKVGTSSWKKKHVKRRVEGGKQYIRRSDGRVWILPQVIAEELTWRRKQIRRKLMALWEPPPPGPPSVGERNLEVREAGERKRIGREVVL